VEAFRAQEVKYLGMFTAEHSKAYALATDHHGDDISMEKFRATKQKIFRELVECFEMVVKTLQKRGSKAQEVFSWMHFINKHLDLITEAVDQCNVEKASELIDALKPAHIRANAMASFPNLKNVALQLKFASKLKFARHKRKGNGIAALPLPKGKGAGNAIAALALPKGKGAVVSKKTGTAIAALALPKGKGATVSPALPEEGAGKENTVGQALPVAADNEVEQREVARSGGKSSFAEADRAANDPSGMAGKYRPRGRKTDVHHVTAPQALETYEKEVAAPEQLAKDVKARKKFKLLSSIMITIAYIFCAAYNLTATWFIMTYTLQYGREDSEQWIMDFFNVFTYDFFIAEPISIVGNGVLVKPLLALLVMPYLKKLKNRIKPPKKTKVAPIESRALPSFYGGGELLVPQGLIEPELNANEVTTTDAARSSDTTVSLLPVEATTVSLQSQGSEQSLSFSSPHKATILFPVE
jgi:hypothetical protein